MLLTNTITYTILLLMRLINGVFILSFVMAVDPLLPIATDPSYYMALTSFGDTLLNVFSFAFPHSVDWIYVV